jgi:hypothetical protein
MVARLRLFWVLVAAIVMALLFLMRRAKLL